MLDACKAEMIQEEFNRRITIGEDFVAWLKEEGEKIGLDPGQIDVKEIHDWIRGLNFIRVTRDDYDKTLNYEMGFKNWKEIKERTEELVPAGSNVIFKMDVDVDSLL